MLRPSPLRQQAAPSRRTVSVFQQNAPRGLTKVVDLINEDISVSDRVKGISVLRW